MDPNLSSGKARPDGHAQRIRLPAGTETMGIGENGGDDRFESRNSMRLPPSASDTRMDTPDRES